MPDAIRTGRVIGRRCGPGDEEVLGQFTLDYRIESLHERPSAELTRRIREGAKKDCRSQRRWVLVAGGEVVACTGFNARIEEAVQVGGVYTPPKLRGRGYGRCVVAASLRDVHAEGIGRAVLFTGLQNVAAQRAYDAIGFQRIGAYRTILFHEPLDIPTT